MSVRDASSSASQCTCRAKLGDALKPDESELHDQGRSTVDGQGWVAGRYALAMLE